MPPMKPIISPEYAALNRTLHGTRADYGAAASQYAGSILKLCRTAGYKSVLDYGCGKGSLKPALAEIAPELQVLEFDPAIEGKDVLPPSPVHLVAAMDVMEHIEPDYLEGALEIISSLSAHGVLLNIALTLASKTLPDGRNAHLIVKPADWWKNTLAAHFKPLSMQEQGAHLIYYGTPLS